MSEESAYDALLQKVQDLERENQRYRRLIENLNDVLYVLDRDATITYVSPNIERVAGYSPEELIGRSYREFIDPADRASMGRTFGRILAGEEQISEHRYRTRNRGAVWAISRDRPVYENGEVVGVQGTLVDITERKRAEAALEENRERTRLIIENAGDMIFTVSGEGRFLYISSNCEAILDYPPEAFIGRSFEEFVHPEDVGRIYTAMLEVFEEYRSSGGVRVNQRIADYRAVTREGEWRWLSAKNTILGKSGDDFELVCIARDVTDQKTAEQRLKESEERYRHLVEASNDIVWTYDLGRMTYTYGSPSLERILGYAQEEADGLTLDDLFSQETKDEVMAAFEEVLSGRNSSGRVLVEAEHQHTEGASVWMEINAVLHRDSLGRPAAFTGISRDITERKKAEAERERLKDQLRQAQKMEALGRMAGAVAHLFNNQLSVVLGHLEMLKEGLQGEPGSRQNVNEAVNAAHRAAHISAQMLAYLGKGRGRPQVLDLSELCCGHLPALRGVIADGVELHPDLIRPGPVVYANAAELQQAVAALVVNACEAMEASSGTVWLRTGVVEAAGLQEKNLYPVDWKPAEKAYAFLEVADTGCGISREEMDKIFDPFYSTRFTGRGLGLAVVLGMARANSGGVGVESEVGRGTRIRIYLPLANHPEEDPAAPGFSEP
jgi:PAS domain S-box-containing protein